MASPDTLRTAAVPSDEAAARALTLATGFFSEDECEVAAELVREALAKGADASGYHFLFADSAPGEQKGPLSGFACFGPVACTIGSFELYWIAVHPGCQGRGLGLLLLRCAEQAMRAMGARRVYAETSSRPQYAPTRAFYERMGYVVDVVQEHFYAPGEAKVTYVAPLAQNEIQDQNKHVKTVQAPRKNIEGRKAMDAKGKSLQPE